jgi:hypothetical protein
MQRCYARRKPVPKAKNIPNKLPEETLDFIIDILSGLHDNSREDEDRKTVTRVTLINVMLPSFRV